MSNCGPKPERCIGCPLYDAPGPVPGFGDENADMFFVGQAPGEHEAGLPVGGKSRNRYVSPPTKRPFTGGSGKLLKAMLMQVGIEIRKSFFANVVRCRPCVQNEKGETVDRPPTKEEMTWCAPFLAEEIARVKPNLIVALGAEALYVFKDRNEIGKFRGQAFMMQDGQQKVFSTFHPAALMRQQRMFPLVLEDLKRAKEESKTKELSRIEVAYRTFRPGEGDLGSLERSILEAGYVVEDLETTGLDGRFDTILCCGFGTRPHHSDCYAWTPQVAEVVRRAHLNENITIVGQNVELFDFIFLQEKDVPYPVGKRWDTLNAFHLISADLPKDLGTLGSVYTDREYWKDKGRNSKSLTQTMEYCNEDIDGTHRAFLKQREEIKYLGMEELWDTVCALQPVLRAMTRRGMKKNEELALTWAVTMRELADQKEQMLQRGLGNVFFSVNSPKQLMTLLYETLGLPVQYTRDKTRGVRPTANAEAMDKLAEITDDPIFHEVNNVRTLRKWAATYCEVETDENGYVHPQFGSAKAANGRLNSWDPNAQNIPNDMREMLIADDDDHVIVSGDWSQVEWNIEMILSADEIGMEIFTKGLDIHTMAATGFTGKAYGEVSKAERHQMKFIVYGLLYGRSARSIAAQLTKEKGEEVSEFEVERMINGFFGRFGAVKAHLDHIVKFVRKMNYLRNPFARRRWWFNRGQETEQYNFLPSSTAADMMYLVLPRLERELPKGATLRLTIHDEVDVVCPKESKTLKQTVECIKAVMQQNFDKVVQASLYPEKVKRFYPQGWAPKVDVTLGNNWKQCKPQTDEEKLWQKEFQKSLLG